MTREGNELILVHVEPIDAEGRQIAAITSPIESLSARAGDLRRGIKLAAEVVGKSLSSVAQPEGWSVPEVEIKFGLTLATEGSVIISKAGVEATFEISITYRRNQLDLLDGA